MTHTQIASQAASVPHKASMSDICTRASDLSIELQARLSRIECMAAVIQEIAGESPEVDSVRMRICADVIQDTIALAISELEQIEVDCRGLARASQAVEAQS